LTSVWQGMKYILQALCDVLCAFWRYMYAWFRLSALDCHRLHVCLVQTLCSGLSQITYQEIFCRMNGQIYVVIVLAENQETSRPTKPVFNQIFLISENCESLSCYCLSKAYYWRSYFWSETVEFLWTLLEPFLRTHNRRFW
jgi:hypothetical protein